MSKEPNDPELRKVWSRVVELENKISSLESMLTRHDERFEWMEKALERVEKSLEKVDGRVWWLLGSVILGIIVTVLTRLI